MLGLLYTAASDFSSFSYPRAYDCLELCHEVHDTPIEERYCPKRHLDASDEKQWDALMQRQVRHFDDLEALPTTIPGRRYSLTVNTALDSFAFSAAAEENEDEDTETIPILINDEATSPIEAPPATPSTICTEPTPSLMDCDEGSVRNEEISSDDESDFDIDLDKVRNKRLTLTVMAASNRKRTKKRGKASPKPMRPVKMLKRSDSLSSISSEASITSMSSAISTSTAAFLQSMAGSENPWKCPHCPWVQHTQRLPDFLRHQRSHFVSQSDWPCPNPKCGKGFARKDSLKRHLDNKATGCKRPPGYMIC